MASTNDPSTQQQQQPTEFELRRGELVGQIGDSLEQVLTQINGLNRSLESIIELGNEFSSVEALWSQFETVMDSQKEANATAAGGSTSTPTNTNTNTATATTATGTGTSTNPNRSEEGAEEGEGELVDG